MDEDYTLEDFENVLSLKNQLILVPLSSLLEVYQDYDSYLTFFGRSGGPRMRWKRFLPHVYL